MDGKKGVIETEKMTPPSDILVLLYGVRYGGVLIYGVVWCVADCAVMVVVVVVYGVVDLCCYQLTRSGVGGDGRG